MGEILEFNNIEKRGREIADSYAEKGDYLRTLSFLYTAQRVPSYKTLMDIADTYFDMGLYELSNQYWFYYIDKAPQEKVSIAYEELAINYFYMDNVLASSYYLHKKLAVDGFITRDGIDKEILDYFEQASQNKQAYRIVYPLELADYSQTLKQAKRELVIGNFNGAVEKYNQIPSGTKQYYDAQTELSIAYFLSGETKKGIEICRNLIKENGYDITLSANLSSMYKYDGNEEKAEYYYLKALEFEPKTIEDRYKISTCALEQGDTDTAIKNIEYVLKDRPYDTGIKFFYGLVLINCKNFEKAVSVFSDLYIINPKDLTIEYYLKLASSLLEGDEKAKEYQRLLPLAYIESIPISQVKKREKKIKELASADEKTIKQALKKTWIKDYLKWGIRQSNDTIVRASIFIIAHGDDSLEQILLDALLDIEVSAETKRLITYILILNGRKKKFSIVAHNIIVTIKPKKLPCERAEDGGLFFSAYALCLSKMAFMSNEINEKVAMTANKVYQKLRQVKGIEKYSAEEVAGLIAVYVKPLEIPESQVLKVFKVKKNTLQKLKKLYNGEKDETN